MFRYILAASALNAFSLNPTTERLYRRVGNELGARRRTAKVDLKTYVSRGDLLVGLVRKYSSMREGQYLLEIGTGWMHWFALYLRLFLKAEIATVDVWDNRQFKALKSAFERLEAILIERVAPRSVLENLRAILSVQDFGALYRRLNLSYTIQKDGSLAAFTDNSCDCVFSLHVLEHVPRESVNCLCTEMYRVLIPGGFTIHQIGIDDHLSHYDRSCSPKQYLAYSDRRWKLLFENSVQYINRLQMSDWLRAFGTAGFVVRETLPIYADVSGLRVHSLYAGYGESDLACRNLTVVLQKPITPASTSAA
jgi:SAM-dependent methyltransferase